MVIPLVELTRMCTPRISGLMISLWDHINHQRGHCPHSHIKTTHHGLAILSNPVTLLHIWDRIHIHILHPCRPEERMICTSSMVMTVHWSKGINSHTMALHGKDQKLFSRTRADPASQRPRVTVRSLMRDGRSPARFKDPLNSSSTLQNHLKSKFE